jgi:hypothetical protein
MAISRMQQPRQQYGLGKLVKKAFKGVKKIVKSPIGKAALLGGLGMYGMGAGPFSGLKGAGFLKGMMGGKMLPPSMGFKSKGLGGFFTKGLGRFLNPWSSGKFSGKHAFGLGAAGLIAAPFLQKAMGYGPYEESEEEGPDWSQTPGSILNIRNMARQQDPSLAFLPSSNYTTGGFYAADGGRAGLLNGGEAGEAQMEQMLRAEYLKYRNKGGTMPYEQFKILVMKQAQQGQTPNQMMAANGGRIGAQEGGMMDMGGMEKDYREEGGFVPIGGEERADDVPARLSKNEFVFTADAVRNAGGGDIDRGSEVMQNMMDNLEQGGEISEESQGLEGGEEIMSEEIIDESNPAQGMYDNYEQLQSRVA